MLMSNFRKKRCCRNYRHAFSFGSFEAQVLNLAENDRSLTFHSCYSPIRRVQALQDYLLHLFNQAQDLTPKDVVVMVMKLLLNMLIVLVMIVKAFYISITLSQTANFPKMTL